MLEGLKWLFSLVVGRRKEKVPLIDLRAPPQVKRWSGVRTHTLSASLSLLCLRRIKWKFVPHPFALPLLEALRGREGRHGICTQNASFLPSFLQGRS